MKPHQALRKLLGLVDDWFTAPARNAAGRVGIFRILYCLFYLWHLSNHFSGRLSGLPSEVWFPAVLVDWIPKGLPPLFFQSLESALVAALLVLLVGYRVRAMTALVLLGGSLLEGFDVSLVGDHSTVFLTFYIPLFMVLNGRWGRVYSLDAVLWRRAGNTPVDPADSSWPYFLPARCILVILLVLFTSSGLLKVFAGGTWFERPDLLANIMLETNVKSAVLGLPLNPLAPFIAEHAVAFNFLRYQTAMVESSFVFALLSPTLCRLYLSYALVFHAINALWLGVRGCPSSC